MAKWDTEKVDTFIDELFSEPNQGVPRVVVNTYIDPMIITNLLEDVVEGVEFKYLNDDERAYVMTSMYGSNRLSRGCSKSELQSKFLEYNLRYTILDECHYLGGSLFDVRDYGPENLEKDWNRTKFKQDINSSTPSDAKRAKLRAKRKRK